MRACAAAAESSEKVSLQANPQVQSIIPQYFTRPSLTLALVSPAQPACPGPAITQTTSGGHRPACSPLSPCDRASSHRFPVVRGALSRRHPKEVQRTGSRVEGSTSFARRIWRWRWRRTATGCCLSRNTSKGVLPGFGRKALLLTRDRYEGLAPNASLANNMLAGAFAGVAVRSPTAEERDVKLTAGRRNTP